MDGMGTVLDTYGIVIFGSKMTKVGYEWKIE